MTRLRDANSFQRGHRSPRRTYSNSTDQPAAANPSMILSCAISDPPIALRSSATVRSRVRTKALPPSAGDVVPPMIVPSRGWDVLIWLDDNAREVRPQTQIEVRKLTSECTHARFVEFDEPLADVSLDIARIRGHVHPFRDAFVDERF
jgi:hypothetical protein